MIIGKLLDNTGAGLLEVLVGMLVIAIGLLGLAPMLALSIDGNSIARDNNVVSNLLKEKIEYYEGLPASSMPAVPYTETENETYLPSGDAEESNGGFNFRRSTILTDNTVNSSVPDGLYELQVTVSWTDTKDVQRNISYKTFLVKN